MSYNSRPYLVQLNIDRKSYKRDDRNVLLRNFTLRLKDGESVAVLGESGVGKSTLLNILGLIDRKFHGHYIFSGQDTKTISSTEAARIRNRRIGFVLQEAALIDSLPIGDNIALPFLYASGESQSQVRTRVELISKRIGIYDLLNKKPLECSGGERARAALARGVIMEPELILADEPTAALDDQNASKVNALLFDFNSDHKSTLVTVTHNRAHASLYGRTIELERK